MKQLMTTRKTKNKIEFRPKALAKGYHPSAFFYKERRKEGVRLTAWTPQLDQLKQVFYDLLETFPEGIEVLLKTMDDQRTEKWKRFYGRPKLSTLREVIRSNEKFVFQDGGGQLSIKNPHTREYITLDEHGTLYVYSDSSQFLELFRRHRFTEQKKSLILDFGHWHVFPKAADRLRIRFIKALNLKRIIE